MHGCKRFGYRRRSVALQCLAGGRVVRIEGRSPESLFQGSKVLLGGNAAERKIWPNDWIESAGVLHALGLAKSPDSLSMTLRLPDGRTVDRALAMVPASRMSPTAQLVRLWSPEPVAGEQDWTPALKRDGLPLYLRDADRPFRLKTLPDLNALYVQFRSNEDEDGYPIATFLSEVNARIAATHPVHLILDLRFDIGGNLLTTLEFMRHAADLVKGRTFLTEQEIGRTSGRKQRGSNCPPHILRFATPMGNST